MNHYTINTGHNRVSPRHEVRNDIIDLCQPYLATGRHKLPMDGYEIDTVNEGDGLVFTVYRTRDNAPLVTCGVAKTESQEDVVWSALETLYHRLTDQPIMRSADFEVSKRPDSLPWLAVITIAPSLDESWLADFERCVAWTWLES